MEYHPGGEDEMMRGAGIDGTALFDDVRPAFLDLLDYFTHQSEKL